MDYEQYINSTPRILWILKEANSEDIDWTLRDALKDLKHESGRGLKSGWANTFTNIVYATNGLFTGEDWASMGDFNNDQSIIDVLQKVAFINVKNIPGGSNADWQQIKNYYSEKKEGLHEQIKLINPEVVIFGNTFSFFDKDFFDSFGDLTSKIDNNNLHIHENEDILFLSAYHPNNRKVTSSEYCNLITQAYKDWKIKYNK